MIIKSTANGSSDLLEPHDTFLFAILNKADVVGGIGVVRYESYNAIWGS